ncbi:MAG: response regulator [Limisphaerales bacterium]
MKSKDRRERKDAAQESTPSTPTPPAAPVAARRRIMLVEDHPILRLGLAQLIGKEADLEICGEAGNPAEAMTLLDKVVPDLLLTDMNMPGRSGMEFVRDIRARFPDLAILILSMNGEDLHAERALKAGAQGYIMKGAGGEELMVAIRKVLGGGIYLSPAITEKVVKSLGRPAKAGSQPGIADLTDREFEVFRLIGQGMTTREIAGELGLSPKTVDVHRGHIKEKLKLPDSTALIHYATRWMETEQNAFPPQG